MLRTIGANYAHMGFCYAHPKNYFVLNARLQPSPSSKMPGALGARPLHLVPGRFALEGGHNPLHYSCWLELELSSQLMTTVVEKLSLLLPKGIAGICQRSCRYSCFALARIRFIKWTFLIHWMDVLLV